jgi:hypothetical protein
MVAKLCLLSAIAAFLITGQPQQVWAAKSANDKPYATVVKVDGDGFPKVRRRAGTVSTAGVEQEILAGDRIITDGKSIVELALNDGTLVRVGPNSEYRLEAAEPKQGFVSWVFHLTRGSVRALVEKSPDKRNVRFRVNTPAGTMGVRGTELVLMHRQDTGVTTLYTIEGLVEFGALDCPRKRSCVEVATGQSSYIKRGQAAPSDPAAFDSLALLRGGASGGEEDAGTVQAAGPSQEQIESLALFLDMNQAAAGGGEIGRAGDAAALLKRAEEMLARASSEMADHQDRLLERDKALREQMHAAMNDGTFNSRMKVAERFDDAARGSKRSGQERAREAYSGPLQAKKFALSEALLKTEQFSAEAAIIRAQRKPPAGSVQATSLEETQRLMNAALSQLEKSQAIATQVERQAAAVEAELAALDSKKSASLNKELTLETTGEMLSKDKLLGTVYDSYTHTFTYIERSCGLFGLSCKDKTRYASYEDQRKESLYQTATGTCYKTVQNCKVGMIPCDLSSGKYCKPTYQNICKEDRVQVRCPPSTPTGGTATNTGTGGTNQQH